MVNFWLRWCDAIAARAMVRGLSMLSFTNCTRLALIGLSCSAIATGGFAHADTPTAGAIPPGWVWQGVWQDGRWSGRWTPGPGVAPAAPETGSYAPPQGFGPSMPQQGPAPVAPAYPAMAFGTPETPPMGYMMVPVPTGRQQPCVETRTVTTEYITDRPQHIAHRVIRAKPHHKDKRVYTGS
jgi:hypothetical protein